MCIYCVCIYICIYIERIREKRLCEYEGYKFINDNDYF